MSHADTESKPHAARSIEPTQTTLCAKAATEIAATVSLTRLQAHTLVDTARRVDTISVTSWTAHTCPCCAFPVTWDVRPTVEALAESATGTHRCLVGGTTFSEISSTKPSSHNKIKTEEDNHK